MNRRGFLHRVLGIGAALGTAALVKIKILENIPEEVADVFESAPDLEDGHVDKVLPDISTQYVNLPENSVNVMFPIQEHEVVEDHMDDICATWLACTKCGVSYIVTDRVLAAAELPIAQLFALAVGPCRPLPTQIKLLEEHKKKFTEEYYDTDHDYNAGTTGVGGWQVLASSTADPYWNFSCSCSSSYTVWDPSV